MGCKSHNHLHATSPMPCAYALFRTVAPYCLAKEFVADLPAIQLIKHLEAEGFVILKGPPIGGHSINWGQPRDGRSWRAWKKVLKHGG
jgi:hypothetical protein